MTPPTLNPSGQLAAANAEIRILQEQIRDGEKTACVTYRIRLSRSSMLKNVDDINSGLWTVQVEARIPAIALNPAFFRGFLTTPVEWDGMIAGSSGEAYLELMGPMLSQDPHFAPIRDAVESLLLLEFGPRLLGGCARENYDGTHGRLATYEANPLKVAPESEIVNAPAPYRFDYGSREVHEYCSTAEGYLYIGGFVNFGINPSDSEETAIGKIEDIEFEKGGTDGGQ